MFSIFGYSKQYCSVHACLYVSFVVFCNQLTRKGILDSWGCSLNRSHRGLEGDSSENAILGCLWEINKVVRCKGGGFPLGWCGGR